MLFRSLERRRDQATDIDLLSGAEDDTVLVDDENGTVGLQRTQYRRRCRRLGRIAAAGERIELADDAIQRDPVRITLLIEGKAGILADVERVPRQYRLLLVLLDGDFIAAMPVRDLGRHVGAVPSQHLLRELGRASSRARECKYV